MSEESRTTLGPYRVLRRLGAGGMSTVYEAEDPRLERRVALKTLPEMWAQDEEQLRRFRREAQTLARLNHPNIVTIYSVEEADDLLFLSMEWVDGVTLSHVVPERGLPLQTFFAYALQIADALEAAHQRNVIHRDIKPGNIMVTPEDRIKVLDFGLAKRRQPSSRELLDSQTLTAGGQMVGTLPYMSPEQLQGTEIDHRSDIFSLGILLYEMAIGRRPFQGESWGDLASSILRDDPPSVSQQNLHLPRHLGRILRHCLEKDVKRRFQTMLDLRNELAELRRELETGELPSSAGTAISFRRQRFYQRKRWWLGAAAGVAIGLTAGIGLLPSTDDGSGAPQGAVQAAVKRVVILPFENLGPQEEAYFAAGVTEEITGRLSAVQALRVVSRRALGDEARKDADFILEGSVRWNAGSEISDRRVRVTPRLIRVEDGAQLWSRSYERVIDDLFAVQSEIAAEIIRQMDIVLVEGERKALDTRLTESGAAYQAFLQGMELAGRRNPTTSHWQQAVERFERAIEIDPDFALAWAELSEVHSLVVQLDLQGARPEEALRTVQRALEIDPDLPQAHRALGYYHYWCHRDYDQALNAFRRAAEGLPNDSQVLGGMAFVRRRLGQFEQAALSLRRALDYDPDSAWLASELGDTLRRLRRYAEADPFYARAMELEPGEPSAFQQRCLNALQWQGDLDGCRRWLTEMPQQTATSSRLAWFHLEILEGHWPAALGQLEGITAPLLRTDDNRIPIEYLRAKVYALEGQSSRSLPLFAAARRSLERTIEKEGEDPRLLHGLSEVLVALGEEEEAVTTAERALFLIPVEKDALTGTALLENLAAVHAGLGHTQEAVENLQKALAIPGDLSRQLLRIDPRWARVRDAPEFQELLPQE